MKPPVIGLVLLAVVFVILAALYYTGSIQFLASSSGPHHKHAYALIGLAVVTLIAANFVRSRPTV